MAKFGDHIWIHHEEWIQISTNKPSSGSIICETGFEKLRKFEEIKIILCVVKQMPVLLLSVVEYPVCVCNVIDKQTQLC